MPAPASRLCLALLTAALAVAQAPPPAERLERLAAFGKLWAAVKYFHPWLAHKPLDWDAALLENLPRAASAAGPSEYAAAVQSMLAALGDPATRVLPPTPPPPAGDFDLIRWTGGRTLVATINPATIGPASARALEAAVERATSVVFDLRRQEAWAGAESARTGLLFVAAGLNAQLASGSLRAPGQRSRVHSGLAAPWDGGSVYYHSAFYVRDGAVLEGGSAGLARSIAFLVDRSSNLPPLAVALQDAGRAKIVADGGLSDASLVDRNLIELPGGLRVELRTTELVHGDNTSGLAADLTVTGGRDALEAALALVRGTSPAPAAARSPLPPYGVPRREEPYAAPEFPSWPRRMLAVFRIWAAFEYFHAYRSLMDSDWDGALLDALARADRAQSARDYALAIASMLARTGDSHVSMRGSRAFDDFLGAARPHVETRIIEGLPVVTRAPEGLGLSPGDVVLSVDGEPAAARIARLKPYFAASTPQSLDYAIQQVWLGGAPATSAALLVRGADGRERRVLIARHSSSGRTRRSGEVVRILAGNIGYVDLDRLAPSGVDSMFEKLKDARAIVFDMRGYPQGTAWLIAPRLTGQRQVVAARFRRPLAMAPPGHSGDVAVLGAASDFVQYLPDSDKPKYLGPTVLLIDERAMSQAEHLGLFFKAANNTVFVGSATAGANGDVSYFTVPGGITIGFSGQEVLHPDGRPLQRVGLVPDIEVKPTIEGIRAGRDEVLERALEYLGVEGANLAAAGEAR